MSNPYLPAIQDHLKKVFGDDDDDDIESPPPKSRVELSQDGIREYQNRTRGGLRSAFEIAAEKVNQDERRTDLSEQLAQDMCDAHVKILRRTHKGPIDTRAMMRECREVADHLISLGWIPLDNDD
jgi:hypothetical protein